MRRVCLYLFIWALSPTLAAQAWLENNFHDFEELRLRQLHKLQTDHQIESFTTDGCSGFQSASWEWLANHLPGFRQRFQDKPPWEHCCVAHDKVYWRGDTNNGFDKRLQADQALKQCVVETGAQLAPRLSQQYDLSEQQIRQGFSVTADLMYKAVRIGGQPCSLLPWRWGYGWPHCAFVQLSERPAKYSDLKDDERVTLFNTAAWLDEDASHWHIPLHAWVYEPEDSIVRLGVIAQLLETGYGLKPGSSVEEANFRNRTNLLLSDNERNKRVVVRIAGREIELPTSAANGHAYSIVKLPADEVAAFANHGRLHFFAITRPGDQRRFEGDVKLVANSGIAVISDIDDTVKVSHVTDHRRLFDHTFFKDFMAVPGMPALYRQLAERGVSIHFVSSSPWYLYEPLWHFLQTAGFPWAAMSLKDVRFRDETLLNLFKKGTETKPLQIEPILQRYPHKRFILIGDSGEQDPEVYAGIMRRYPQQVLRILIRTVDDSDADDPRYRNAFGNIDSNRWQLFDNPAEIVVDELLATDQAAIQDSGFTRQTLP